MVTFNRISHRDLAWDVKFDAKNMSNGRPPISRPLGDTVRFAEQPINNKEKIDVHKRRTLGLLAGAGLYGLASSVLPTSLVRAEEVKPWKPSVSNAHLETPLRDWMKEEALQQPFYTSVMPPRVAEQINEMVKAIREGRADDASNLIAGLSNGTSEEVKKFMYMLRFSMNDVEGSDRYASMIQKIMMNETQNLDKAEISRLTNLLKTLFTKQEYETLERIVDETSIRIIPSGDDTFIKAFAYCLAVKDDKELAMNNRLIQKLQNNQRLTQEEMDVLKGRITILFSPTYQELLTKAIYNVDKTDPTFDPESAYAVMLGYKPRKPKKGEKPISEALKETLTCKVALLTKYKDDAPYHKLVEHVNGLLTTDDCKNLYDILKKDKAFQQKYKDKYGTENTLKAFASSKNISDIENGDRLAAVVRGLPLKAENTKWVVEQIALFVAATYPTYGLSIAAKMLTQLLQHGIDPFPRSTLLGTTAFTNAIASIEATGNDDMVKNLLSVIEREGKRVEDKPDFMGRNSLRYLSLIRKTHPGKVRALERILQSSNKSGAGYKVKADLPDHDFGITPLMSAAFMGDANYIKTLLANTKQPSDPLSFLPSFLRIKTLLPQSGNTLDINRHDKTADKMTPLHYAIQSNRKESVLAFLEAHNNATHRLNWSRNQKALDLAHHNEDSKFRDKAEDLQSYNDAKAIAEAIETQMAKDTGDTGRYLPSLAKFFERRGSSTPAASPQ